MGRFDGFLLVSDLDNTILGSDGKISEKNLEAIERFKAQGGLFTMSTGRTIGSLMQYFKNGTLNAPIITSNGAVICEPNTYEHIWSLNLDKNVCMNVIEYVTKNAPFAGCEIYSHGIVYLHKENLVVEQHMDYERFKIERLPLEEIPEPWHRVVFAQEPEETDQLIKLLKDTSFGSDFKLIRGWTKYYEMVHRETGKGRALGELSKITGVSKSHIIAVGDYYNDIDMIEAAGVGIATQNAVDELKQAAKYVTEADFDNGAICEIIEKLERGEFEIT